MPTSAHSDGTMRIYFWFPVHLRIFFLYLFFSILRKEREGCPSAFWLPGTATLVVLVCFDPSAYQFELEIVHHPVARFLTLSLLSFLPVCFYLSSFHDSSTSSKSSNSDHFFLIFDVSSIYWRFDPYLPDVIAFLFLFFFSHFPIVEITFTTFWSLFVNIRWLIYKNRFIYHTNWIKFFFGIQIVIKKITKWKC